MKFIQKCIAVIALVICAACQSTGGTTGSPEQQVVTGYATVAGVRETAANLLTSKIITVSDAKMVQGLADQARAALDLAKGATQNGKTTDAQAQLVLATQVLVQLQTYLQSKQPQSQLTGGK